ncbi:MAG TPA: hypothetical protein DEO64_00465 [Alcaligenes faecalis]|nr:hypothetical protein [Alcaligenes faecalis]
MDCNRQLYGQLLFEGMLVGHKCSAAISCVYMFSLMRLMVKGPAGQAKEWLRGPFIGPTASAARACVA